MHAYPRTVKTEADRGASATVRLPDALVQLKATHCLIEDQFDAYFRFPPGAIKQNCLAQIRASVTVHITLLSFYFHPAIAPAFEGSAEFARRSVVKYARFKELLCLLEEAPSIEEIYCEIQELRKYFQQHVKEEETVIFPLVRKSNINLIELGETLYRAKMHLENEVGAQIKKRAGQLTIKSSVRRYDSTMLRH